jgi:hypothetical protein
MMVPDANALEWVRPRIGPARAAVIGHRIKNRPWQPPPRLVCEFFVNTHILEHPGLFLFLARVRRRTLCPRKDPIVHFARHVFSTGTGRRDDQSSRRFNHQEKSNRQRDAFFI